MLVIILMGAYLGQANKEKHIDNGCKNKLHYGVCSMQGWRANMEDSHIVELDIDEELSLFCVFDGHGGTKSLKS